MTRAAASNTDWMLHERVRLLEERVQAMEELFDELASQVQADEDFELASLEEVDGWAEQNAPSADAEED